MYLLRQFPDIRRYCLPLPSPLVCLYVGQNPEKSIQLCAVRGVSGIGAVLIFEASPLPGRKMERYAHKFNNFFHLKFPLVFAGAPWYNHHIGRFRLCFVRLWFPWSGTQTLSFCHVALFPGL